ASVAEFRTPVDVAVAADGTVFIVDAEAGQLRRLRDGQVSTLAGVDTEGCLTALRSRKTSSAAIPAGCPDQLGAFYRDGSGSVALFNQPTSVTIGQGGDHVRGRQC